MEVSTLTPLKSLKDLEEAVSVARCNYNHSEAKIVSRRKRIQKSKNTAFLSSFSYKSSEMDVDIKKNLPHHSKSKKTVKESNHSVHTCSKERLIQIFVYNLVKAPLCLRLYPSTTILDLKELIQHRLGVQPEKQHLSTRKGFELCDSLTLKDHNIEQDTNLELSLVHGLMGGGVGATRKRKSKGTKINSANKIRRGNQSDESKPAAGMSWEEFFLSKLWSLWNFIWNVILNALTRFFVKEEAREQNDRQEQASHDESARQQQTGQQHSVNNQGSSSTCVHNINVPGSGNSIIVGPTGTTVNINKEKPGSTGGDDTAVQTKAKSRQARNRHQKAARMCKKALRTKYKIKEGQVEMNPLLDKKNILDIFTELELECQEGGDRKKLTSYEEMFTIKTKDGLLVNRTILEGKAGLGKSTLVSKIAYDWASDSSATLKKYTLVFVLKMHALEETSDFMDAIHNQLLDEDTIINMSDLRSYIQANQKNVLILLDGFDELRTTTLNEERFKSVLKILGRKTSSECCVVVSTRPSHYHVLNKTLVKETFNRVKVLGFREEDMEKYVKKFYLKDDQKAQRLLQRIRSSDVLSEMVKSPMLILLICALWKEDSSLPLTLFRLFKQTLMDYIFKRRNTDMQEEELSHVVTEIGKVALKGLLSQEQLLSFPESLFEKSVLDSAMKAGVLTSQRVLKGLTCHNSIQFFHKMMQEFCAAFFLQSLKKSSKPEDLEEFQKNLSKIESMSNPSRVDYLLRFCCGDNDECTDAIIKILMKKCQEDHSLALNCYFENQSKLDLTMNFIKYIVTDELCIEAYTGDTLQAFVYFLNLALEKRDGDACLDKVKKIVIERCNLERYTKDMLDVMSRIPNLSTVELKYCHILGESEPWASRLFHIQELCLQQCSLTHQHVKLIALPSVVELNLSCNRALGGSSKVWVPYLMEMQKLCKLNLGDCALIGADVEHISALHTIFNLNLSHNEALGGSASSWSPRLKRLKDLQKLKLKNCSLKGQDVEALAVSLSEMVNLTKLQLSGNVKLNHSASVWAEHLCRLIHLKKLILNDCDIETNGLRYIAKSVNAMTDLDSCSVDNNIHPKWNYEFNISQRTILKIRGFSLSCDNLKDILNEISGIALTSLKCSEFIKLNDPANSWCLCLSQLKHLQLLMFYDCKLQSEDIQAIADQLRNMPDLTQIYLNNNSSLKGCAKTWFPCLQCLKPLEELVVDECNLTKEDFTYIAKFRGCKIHGETIQFTR